MTSLAAVLTGVMALGGATVACATQVGAARSHRPPGVTARPLTKQSGDVGSGALATSSELKGERTFTSRSDGYALATINRRVYPAKTVDGGSAWRVNGPEFYRPGAHAAVAVGTVGTASPTVAYAWGGAVPNTVVDATTDGGQEWWQAFLPGDVLFVSSSRGVLSATVFAAATGNQATGSLVAYTTRTGRRWTYAYRLS